MDVFDKSFPHEPVAQRLSDLDKEVFGAGNDPNTKSDTSAIEHIARLLAALKPSDELVSMVVIKASSTQAWSFKSTKAPWIPTHCQLVSTLEEQLNGKTKSDALLDRINALEKLLLPAGDIQPAAGVKERIDSLLAVLPLSEKATEKAKQNSGGFWNPPQIHWLSSLGKGAKNMGKSMADSTKAVASSPTFWMLLLGTGAVASLYFLDRGSSGGQQQQQLPAYIVSENACTGMLNCTHCTSCRYCHYCNSGMNSGFCGVKIRIMQYSR